MSLRSFLPQLSISTRLALWYGLSLLILLTLFVVYLYTSVHMGLHRDFERQLRAEAEALAERLDPAPPARAEGTPSLLPIRTAHGTFARVLSADGQVLQVSEGFADRPRFAPHLPAGVDPAVRGHTWGGVSARTLYLPLAANRPSERETQERPAAWLEVTRLESSIHREMHRLGWLLAIGIAAGVVVAIGSGYGLARRALRPVAALTAAARDIQEEPTGELPTDFGVRDELTDLAETFNAMLARIRSAFQRERRFRADAAHKLFTPLTAIRSELDVTLRKPRSTEAYREALRAIHQHTETLTDMLDELMTLSEVEAISVRDGAAPVDLAYRVRGRVQGFRARARRRGIHLQCEVLEEQWVAVPSDYVDTLIDNLIDNALKYTPEGGHVQITLRSRGDAVVLRIEDDGIGFDPSNADRLFDRFYRTDVAGAKAPGSGLGLSIVKAIAEGYGGTVVAKSDGAGAGSIFEVRLPCANGS